MSRLMGVPLDGDTDKHQEDNPRSTNDGLEDSIEAQINSLHTPSSLARLLISRIAPQDIGPIAPEFLGAEARLKAVSAAAHEEHQELVKQMFARSVEMDHGILGAEIYEDNLEPDGEKRIEKRRRLSRASMGAGPLAVNSPVPRVRVRPDAGKDAGRADGGESSLPRSAEVKRSGNQPVEENELLSAENLPKGSTERRRAQMRQAQRNYRLRREATIAALEIRNKQLEEAVEGMTKAYMYLQDAAIESEAYARSPEFAAQIKWSSTEFMAWVKKAGQGGGDGGGEDENERENGEAASPEEETLEAEARNGGAVGGGDHEMRVTGDLNMEISKDLQNPHRMH